MERPERTMWLPSIRAYPWERELVERAAAAEQVRVSEYIRQVLITAARERLGRDRGR